ncbi:hypothetical protein Tco_1181631, partial [Tanacetum coccineum]
MKTSQSRRRKRVVLSDEEEVSKDPSKQGRSLIEELDLDAEIPLVPLHDAEIQEKISDDTKVLLEEEEIAELVEEATELVEDPGSGEKGEQEVTTADTTLNTASVSISTASATPEVNIVAANLVYIRRSVDKRKDKGKAIMIEDESVQKKSKKQLGQERLSYEEAIRLQEHIDEEERDAEIAKQLQEEYDKAGKKEDVAEVDTAHVIDWNDPSGGYKIKDFKGMSYDDIRLIFEKVWDQVHSFVPMDSEEEVQRLKRAGQDIEAKPAKRQRTEEVSKSVQEQTDEEPKTDELVGNYTEMYQVFEDMPKNFDRDDLEKLWILVQERYNSSGLTKDKEIELWVKLKMLFEPDAENILELQKYMHDPLKWTKLSTARPKLSADSTKIESMKLEAMVEERRIVKCWFHYHTTNGYQFTMSNRHQELASPKQMTSALAISEQMATGKEISNPFMTVSLDLSRLATTLNMLERSIHWDQQLIYSMAGSDDENPPPPPPPQTPTQQAPHTLLTIKLLMLKKGEYDIWAMKMEHYLEHTDYPIWEVIQKRNGTVQVSTDTNGQIKVLPPKTAEEILAREKERKARTTLLMAIPEDHLAKFHKMTDAKEIWETIKSRFCGNDESNKMQKYILKQQFESFYVSNSEGLYKGYDRFQSLLSQLEIHGAGISTEDANQKFLRSLPAPWS